MYPRNNASPERIAIGQVVLIADGTIQSSGVAVTVRGQGGAEAGSAGTIAYGADNTVYYTPTQAETNYTSFVLIASKASCFSASQTVITTASSTAGQVDVKSIAGTAQTANDNGADINTLLTRIVGTLAAGTHNPASAAQIAVLSDWIDAGRLDAILDTIAADTTTDIPALIATAQADLDTITGADGAALASTQQSITFQPIEITAGDAIDNITLSGTGTSDGIAFTRSGAGDPFDTNFMAQINSEVDTALSDYDAATGTELAAVDGKIDAQDAIITETRLAELDAANLPADVDSILADTASIGITKNATFSNLEFLMVDATDHVTPETGLTVTGEMSIDGAAFAAVNGAIAEVSNGIYQIDLTAADTNGDVITYRFSSAGAADTFVTIKTRA